MSFSRIPIFAADQASERVFEMRMRAGVKGFMQAGMTEAEGSEQARIIRVMFGGDVMLGRNVKEYILRDGPGYPLGRLAQRMRTPDLTVINLECALTSSLERWPGTPKAYYFGAPPQAIETLAGAGVDMVSLANNHTLDYGVEGLSDTLQQLRRHGIRYAGAGLDREEAQSAAIACCQGITIGMAAFCDHQADFAAGGDCPGISYLDLDDEAAALDALDQALEPLRRAAVDWPVLSLHWGPNMVNRPSQRFRRVAHAAIDMGWKILYGHSAHVFQGIELRRRCPILYAAGDLVDDYCVDAAFRNDHQLLFELELTHDALRGIALYPVFIERCRAGSARGEQARYIAERMTALCRELGTQVRQDADGLRIEGAD